MDLIVSVQDLYEKTNGQNKKQQQKKHVFEIMTEKVYPQSARSESESEI